MMRCTSVGRYHIRLTLQTEAIGSVMEKPPMGKRSDGDAPSDERGGNG